MKLDAHAFSLRQLQYAVAVADALSFRRAAERCHVSQPALSAQLALLEGALGVRLFERDRRHVVLTPAGTLVVERARALLRDADDLVGLATRAGDPLAGTLRVGVIPTLSPYLLPEIAPALRARFPRLTLLWSEDKTASLVAQLDRGDLDAALLAREAALGDVEGEPIARDAFLLALPPRHPLATAREPLTPKALRDEPVLLLDDGHCFRDQALSFCERARAQELEFRATSLSTLSQMVASGAGVTLLPEVAARSEAARAKLKLRRFAAPEPGRTVALVWRKRSALAPSLRKVAEVLRAAYPAKALGKRPR
ncbi:MAG: LysR family transcriptional regulator [Deltaproteobacteria bacterium]|nr:LysR family transcriptional regulator [Deltaproteobacteria bacterium]